MFDCFLLIFLLIDQCIFSYINSSVDFFVTVILCVFCTVNYCICWQLIFLFLITVPDYLFFIWFSIFFEWLITRHVKFCLTSIFHNFSFIQITSSCIVLNLIYCYLFFTSGWSFDLWFQFSITASCFFKFIGYLSSAPSSNSVLLLFSVLCNSI